MESKKKKKKKKKKKRKKMNMSSSYAITTELYFIFGNYYRNLILLIFKIFIKYIYIYII